MRVAHLSSKCYRQRQSKVLKGLHISDCVSGSHLKWEMFKTRYLVSALQISIGIHISVSEKSDWNIPQNGFPTVRAHWFVSLPCACSYCYCTMRKRSLGWRQPNGLCALGVNSTGGCVHMGVKLWIHTNMSYKFWMCGVKKSWAFVFLVSLHCIPW